MPLIKTYGLILNSRSMGEIDRMVEIYTKDIGRIQGIAKGARSFKNRFGGSLEPFTHCRLNLFRKRDGALFRIESADIVESFRQIRGDLALILHSSCMIDTLRKLTPLEDTNKTIFSILRESLERVAAGDPADKVLFYCQIRLLYISGIGPRLDSCIKCNKAIKDTRVFMSVAEGGLVCNACNKRTGGKYIVATGGAIAVMRKWQSTALYHLNRFKVTDNVKSEIRDILDMYISYVTGKKVVDMKAYLS